MILPEERALAYHKDRALNNNGDTKVIIIIDLALPGQKINRQKSTSVPAVT